MPEYAERKCRICGKPFKPKNRVQVYCGYDCQRESNRENARRLMVVYREKRRAERPKTAVCLICGKKFEKKSGKQMYCGSAECARERMRRYSKERWANRKIIPQKAAVAKPEIPKIKPHKGMTLREISAAAAQMDISYGQYVARYL